MKNFAEKTVTLDCIDRKWTKHIDQMAKLRDAIWLRSYAQTDPLQAYTNEGFDMFNKMNETIACDASRTLLHVAFQVKPQNAEATKPGIDAKTPIKKPDVKFNPEVSSNVKPDDDGIDRSNPTAKIN